MSENFGSKYVKKGKSNVIFDHASQKSHADFTGL
jgi:hypothetical protein